MQNRPEAFRAALSGGDMRTIGRANETARKAAQSPAIFARLIDLLFDSDPAVRMRAADALEKATNKKPGLLLPHRPMLIRRLGEFSQQEVQWHVAQMLGYLPLSESQMNKVFPVLARWARKSPSQIVKVNCIQALADLTRSHPKWRSRVISLIHGLARNGSAAIKARAKRLLPQLTGDARE